jgi:hypothetical protein
VHAHKLVHELLHDRVRAAVEEDGLDLSLELGKKKKKKKKDASADGAGVRRLAAAAAPAAVMTISACGGCVNLLSACVA